MQSKIDDLVVMENIKGLNGKAFCPCSGNDISFVLNLIGSCIDKYVFCDLNYRIPALTVEKEVPNGWKLLSSISGLDITQMSKKTRYNGDREFRPSAKIETWRRLDTTEVIIELRKDLAQDFLINNCGNESISCFVHINDGEGEGGSNLRFLGVNADHNGDGFLEEICDRLTSKALVITDGTMADWRLQHFHKFEFLDRIWEPIQKIGGRGDRKIIVWKTTKSTSSTKIEKV